MAKCLALKKLYRVLRHPRRQLLLKTDLLLLRLSMDIWNIARESEETLVTADVKDGQS
jgi:hypothetical protein